MSSKTAKKIRKILRKDKKRMVEELMRQIYHLGFSERFKIAMRILRKK